MSADQQEWHRCDPRIDIDATDTPLTNLRVLRIMRAVLDGLDLEQAGQVLTEFGTCPKCLRQGLSVAVGVAVTFLAERGGTRGDQVMALEMMIAQTEAKLRARDP